MQKERLRQVRLAFSAFRVAINITVFLDFTWARQREQSQSLLDIRRLVGSSRVWCAADEQEQTQAGRFALQHANVSALSAVLKQIQSTKQSPMPIHRQRELFVAFGNRKWIDKSLPIGGACFYLGTCCGSLKIDRSKLQALIFPFKSKSFLRFNDALHHIFCCYFCCVNKSH